MDQREDFLSISLDRLKGTLYEFGECYSSLELKWNAVTKRRADFGARENHLEEKYEAHRPVLIASKKVFRSHVFSLNEESYLRALKRTSPEVVRT